MEGSDYNLDMLNDKLDKTYRKNMENFVELHKGFNGNE